LWQSGRCEKIREGRWEFPRPGKEQRREKHHSCTERAQVTNDLARTGDALNGGSSYGIFVFHRECQIRSHAHDKYAAEKQVKEEQKEIAIVSIANTVPNPWAVVIHLENTYLTVTAMVASFGLWGITLFTPRQRHQAVPALDRAIGQGRCKKGY
jgi:hypothetical protein